MVGRLGTDPDFLTFDSKTLVEHMKDVILNSINDIANGMEYIHGKNIIHGDLK